MSKLPNVFVVSAKAARLADLVPGAAGLGQNVAVICAGNAADMQSAFSLGASTLYDIPKQDGIIFEDYAPSIAKIVREAGGKSLLILPADRRGKAMAAKLAAQLGTSAINEVSAIEAQDSGLLTKRLVYGGLAVGSEEIQAEVSIVTVGSGVFEAQAAGAGSGESKSAEFVAPATAMKLVESRAKVGSSVDIGKAKRVVGVGRGFAKVEDLQLAKDLAAVIEGEVACSRPIAEGEHWMERERYIGVSGVMLKSDIYFTLGISGQIQHMVGANDSKTIIAVNKDKNAPIFNFADYGIVGDLYKVVPAVIKALKG